MHTHARVHSKLLFLFVFLLPRFVPTFLATSKPVLLSMKLLAASLLIACATAQSIVSKIPVVVCTEAF